MRRDARSETLVLEGSGGPMRVQVHRPLAPGAGGVAIIAHGRNGAADAPHIAPIIGAALARGMTVVAPDLCFSAHNASAGEAGGFTMAGHLADLSRVTDWVADHEPAAGPRILVGHSMGAYAGLRLAADGHRWGPTGVIAVSPVISGMALLRAREAQGPQAMAQLEAELPGAPAEWPTHDAIGRAAAITIPAAVIVGADDTVTPPADAATLAAALPNCVWYEVLAGEHHCPLGSGYAAGIGMALDRVIGADAGVA